MQDGGQLLLWDVCYVELKEPRLESLAHRFPPGICSSGVLGCKQHEVWVRPDEFLQLWHKQLSIVVQEPANNLITSHLLAPTSALHSMNVSKGAISIGKSNNFNPTLQVYPSFNTIKTSLPTLLMVGSRSGTRFSGSAGSIGICTLSMLYSIRERARRRLHPCHRQQTLDVPEEPLRLKHHPACSYAVQILAQSRVYTGSMRKCILLLAGSMFHKTLIYCVS